MNDLPPATSPILSRVVIMSIRARLRRLESTHLATSRPVHRSIEDRLLDLQSDAAMLSDWLACRGFVDALDAVAAGESGPDFRTEGWTLNRAASHLRDPIEEAILAVRYPGITLWCHVDRGWTVVRAGRLHVLAPREAPDLAVERYHAAVAQLPSPGN